MLAVCVYAAGLAFLRFSELWWFLAVATFSYANAFVGWCAARKRDPGWLPRHIGGMGGSYIALAITRQQRARQTPVITR